MDILDFFWTFYLNHLSPLWGYFYRPPNEVCKGYVFTGVCLSTGGVCPIACWDTPEADTKPEADTPLGPEADIPPGRHPLGRSPWADTPRVDTPRQTPWADNPPVQCMLGYGQQAGAVVDLGFSPGGAPTPKIAIIFHIFAENCMKMKEFGPPGGRASLAPPLDPPMGWYASHWKAFFSFKCEVVPSLQLGHLHSPPRAFALSE